MPRQARPLGRAALHCVVEAQGPYTVSWIRQADLQILSVGSLLVSSDPRLAVAYSRRRRDHQLTVNLLLLRGFKSPGSL